MCKWFGVCLLLLCMACQEPRVTPKSVSSAPVAEPWLCCQEEVRYGDTLEKILLRQDFTPEQTRPFIAAFAAVCDVRKIIAGKRYGLCKDSAGVLQRLDYYADQELTIQIGRDSTGGWQARSDRRTLLKKIRIIKGVLNYSLYETMLAMGETPELVGLFSDVFQWDLDFFSDPQKGDEFRMICECYYLLDAHHPDSLGALVRYGRILAGEYAQPGKKMAAVYFQTAAERGGYYDINGNSFQKTFLKSPLLYGRVTSRFSSGRRHPILKIVRAHYAIDIAAPAGTPVSAPADGVVIDRGYNSSIGNFIKLQHNNPRFVTLYGHLSRFAQGVEIGSKVRQRDEIGYVGSTGLSTGPHLHYVFYDNHRPVNPEKIKNSSGEPLAIMMRPVFFAARDSLLKKLHESSATMMWTGDGLDSAFPLGSLNPGGSGN
jgi:hypothetical protein